MLKSKKRINTWAKEIAKCEARLKQDITLEEQTSLQETIEAIINLHSGDPQLLMDLMIEAERLML